MKTQISSVSVTFTNGNKIAFEDAQGVDLSKLKTVRTVISEEIKSASPPKEHASTTRVESAN